MWRLKQLLYTVKCYFKRYNTIKCRYLTHGWHDRSTILPHIMFEVLSRYLEEEDVDWDYNITIDGKRVNAKDEMQSLYDWWHNTYNRKYKRVVKRMCKVAEKYDPIPIEECSNRYMTLTNRIFKLEQEMDKMLEEKMILLCRLAPFMWT